MSGPYLFRSDSRCFGCPSGYTRDTTQMCCGCRKQQAPLAFPKGFSLEMQSPQNHSSPSKIKVIFVCLAMCTLTTMLHELAGGCFGPAPALSHAPDMSRKLPEHTFPSRYWTGASSRSPGWLQSVNKKHGWWGEQGGSLHRHILILTKTLIEMSHEGQVAMPHPQPKLRGLEIQVCKVSLHLL